MIRRLSRSFLFCAAAVATSVAYGSVAHSGEVPSSPVTSESGEPDGTVNASALRPLPQGSAITIKPWDNSEDTTILARYIEDQLRARGYSIGGANALVLKFSASETLGQLSSGPQRQLVEIDGRAGSGHDDEAQVRLNLFSSEKGGVFNQGRPQQKVASTQTLEMSIDRPDGQRLWLGEATGKVVNPDRRQSVRLLVGPLLDSIGKTVRSQPFGIPDANK